MRFRTITSPHVLGETSVGQVMRRVLYAMLPGIAALVWFFGWGVLVNLALATAVALCAEAALLAARGKPLALHLNDCSAVVTAWLLAVALPPLAPWWMTTIGVLAAIVVAKHLYGGLGYNPFNPAMIGYVAVSYTHLDVYKRQPQTQCGQCGFAGCRPYAEAIAAGAADINQCPPGGESGIVALAELLGRDPKPLNPENGAEKPKRVAVIDEQNCIGCTPVSYTHLRKARYNSLDHGSHSSLPFCFREQDPVGRLTSAPESIKRLPADYP